MNMEILTTESTRFTLPDSPRPSAIGGLLLSAKDCLEINLACDRFFASRGIANLSWADQIHAETIQRIYA